MVGFRRKELLGADAETYRKVPQLPLDVWFDSGSTYSSVVANRPEFNGQDIDMYLEGSDQHRGWFMSLMLSTANRQQSTIQTSINPWFHRGWSKAVRCQNLSVTS